MELSEESPGVHLRVSCGLRGADCAEGCQLPSLVIKITLLSQILCLEVPLQRKIYAKYKKIRGRAENSSCIY